MSVRTREYSILVERLARELSASMDEGDLLETLKQSRSRGLTRRMLHDALAEAAERHRQSISRANEPQDELVDDILDRLWGHCSKRRLLFPELPPLSD